MDKKETRFMSQHDLFALSEKLSCQIAFFLETTNGNLKFTSSYSVKNKTSSILKQLFGVEVDQLCYCYQQSWHMCIVSYYIFKSISWYLHWHPFKKSLTCIPLTKVQAFLSVLMPIPPLITHSHCSWREKHSSVFSWNFSSWFWLTEKSQDNDLINGRRQIVLRHALLAQEWPSIWEHKIRNRK